MGYDAQPFQTNQAPYLPPERKENPAFLTREIVLLALIIPSLTCRIQHLVQTVCPTHSIHIHIELKGFLTHQLFSPRFEDPYIQPFHKGYILNCIKTTFMPL